MRAVRLTRWLWRRRELLVMLGSAAVLWQVMEWLASRERVGILGLLLVAATVWAYLQPGSDSRPIRSRIRRRWLYWHRWRDTLNLAGLVPNGHVPSLRRVRSTDAVDVVTVKMARGQVLADWSARQERLADGFGAASCWVTGGRRRRTAVLQFTRHGVRTFPADGRW